MKRIIPFIVLILFLAAFQAGKECQVKIPALEGKYIGDCKRGLAHGFGEAIGKKDRYKGQFKKGYPDGFGQYFYADGSIHSGNWLKGLREGEGIFTFKINKHDTSIVGIWKNDMYVGPKAKAPQIMHKNNIDKCSFSKKGADLNRVLIDFRQNGSHNTSISNLMLSSNSGTQTQLGQLQGFENINFPVEITVRYDTKNKLKTQTYHAYVQFTIFEPGDWTVVLNN